MLLELKEQQIKASGLTPEYYLSEGNVKVKDKRKEEGGVGSIQVMSVKTWEYIKTTVDAAHYELVPFKTSAIY